MLSGTLDGIAVKVHAADGGYEYRVATGSACLLHVLAQKIFVCTEGGCATVVDGSRLGGLAHLIIICLQFVAVHAAVLLVVVRELYEHVVASLHLLLYGGPVGCFLVEALAAGTRLAAVVDGYSFKELLQVLRPTTGHGTALIVGLHGGVADGVYGDGLRLEHTQEGHHCQQNLGK